MIAASENGSLLVPRFPARENVVGFETDGRSKRPVIKPDTIVQDPLVTTTLNDDSV